MNVSEAPHVEPSVPRLTARELARRLRAGHDLLLVCAYDSQVAWGKFALEGALPLAELERRRAGLDPQTDVVLYCRCPQDRTAERAARTLLASGLERVRVLEGGFEAARVAGLRRARTS